MNKIFKILEFDKVLEYLSKFAVSELARQKCLETQVSSDISIIENELTLVTQAKKILELNFSLPIDNIKDISKSLQDLKKHVRLCEEEIVDIADVLRTARITRNYLDKFTQEFYKLASKQVNLFVNKELEDKIFSVIDSSFNIKEDASSELKRLYNSLRDTHSNIKTAISSLLSNSDFVNQLQDTVYTQRDGRTVFQVKAECKNKLGGIVHDVSASGQTYFVEPKELIGLHNKVRELEAGIKSEIEKILKELSEEISVYNEELKTSLEQLVEVDYIFAKAKYSIRLDGVEPKISKEKEIILKSMKNPVLMEVTDKIVENDFILEQDKNCMIITGSNTGGKTVAIKTVGLCVLMMKAGLHVPCYEAQIYPFEKIFADIGDEQSIVQSLSTFSGHMNNIVRIIDNSDGESLILLDEIAAGTDPTEGSALAQAILENLQNKGAFCVVTTHYGELKSLAYLKDGFVNASVEFDINTLSPTYKLLIGIPGASNAVAIAKNLGLNESIYEKAREIYFVQKDPSAKVLEELQTAQNQMSKSAKSIQESEEHVKSLETELEEKVQEIKKSKKKNIENYKKKYDSDLSAARAEIKEILKEIRADKSEKIARRSFSRLAAIENRLRSTLNQDEEELSEIYKPIDWSAIKIGDKVLIKDLNQSVELLSLPDKNKNVFIQMGLIKTSIKQDKLAQYDKKLVSTPDKKFNTSKQSYRLTRYDMSQTLDLRGYRCDEALDSLEAYLDKASLANLTPVYVIHGHGTGALKQVIRDYLNDSPYVAKYRPGEQAEGGDGVSVIDIN